MALIKLQKDVVNDVHIMSVLNNNFETVELVNENNFATTHNVYRIKNPTPGSGLFNFPKDDSLVVLDIRQSKSNLRHYYIHNWFLESDYVNRR